MADMASHKRKSIGGIRPGPRYMMREKKAPSEYRRYAEISSSKNKEYGVLSNNFSFQFVQHVLQRSLTAKDPKNLALSPVSIDTVLSIIAVGANGETLDQLLRFLGFQSSEEANAAATKLFAVLAKSDDNVDGDEDEDDDDDDSDDEGAPDISFANGLWLHHQYNLKPSFEGTLHDVYKTQPRAVDFVNEADEVVSEANLWVEQQSKGLVKHILDRNAINNQTRMILANALYFKGDWYETFEPENTKDKYFYLLDGDKVKVPLMKQEYASFDYGTFDGCQVLRVMYKDGGQSTNSGTKRNISFSMYVFLPEEKNGLPKLMDNIKMDAMFFNEKVKLTYKRIDEVSFPKFAFECDLALSKDLEELVGLKLPFDENLCDLKGVVDLVIPGNNLFVDNIYSKCRVETDEEGTTAFVAVSARFGCTGGGFFRAPPQPIKFVADHPFLFVIREDFSGAVLFVGTVLNPLSR